MDDIRTMYTQQGFSAVLAVIIVAIVAVAGGGIYVATQNEAEVTIEDETQMETSETTNASTQEDTTMRELIALGDSLVCTFSRTDAESDVSGTIYVDGANERLSGDFTISTEEMGTMEGHMIKTDTHVYTWTDAMNQGTKMSLNMTSEAESTPQENEAVGLDEEVDYECDSWNVDETRFSVPSDVEFMDMSSMMEASMGAQGNVGANQCAACESIPDGNAKEQCLAALGC